MSPTRALDASAARRSLVRRYYAFTIFFSLLFWLPIFYEFQRRIGLSDQRIFAIQSLYYVVFCVLEIPTGFFADRVGHLSSMRAGALVLVAAHLVPSLSPTDAGMLAHFLLIALSRSLISGASSAYVYERLRELGDTEAYKQIEGRARAYGLVAKVVCWSFVGALMERWLTGPYWLTTASAVLSVGCAYALPRSLGTAPEAARDAPQRLAFTPALAMLRASPVLVLVMLQGIALFVLGRIVQVNLFQPVLAEKGFPVASYGVALAASSIFEAVGSAWPEQLRRLFSDKNAVFVLTLLMAGSMSWLAVSGPVSAAIALSVFSLACGLSFPIQRQLFNDLIPDGRYRATLLSTESIADRAVNALVAASLGGWVASGRTGAFLHLSALVTTAAMAVLFVLMRGKAEPSATRATRGS